MYLRITDIGNFNFLTHHLYCEDGCKKDLDFAVGDVVTVQEILDNSVPSGVYSKIVRVNDKTWITVAGRVLFDRNSKGYQMKQDRFRMQFEKLKAKEVAKLSH